MANSATNFNGTTFMSYRSRAYKSASEKTPGSLVFLCDFLREYGAAVPIDNRGDTVLHLLAINGNRAAFESLLRAGLLTDEALTKKNVHGNTALHEAARSGQTEFAEIMLRRKQDLVFLRNHDMDETPLYVAAAYGKREVFRVLESYRSDCMMRRRDGRTILHAAIDGERYQMVPAISLANIFALSCTNAV
ncbi:phytochrome-interacting ankyrin-repeat protein 1-like [Rhododendron vialii]|uniref:phytochrome-interacting ankyrin-repeat protein 1-like n=1 Tax=Rhododendron vialii TaxID=182163 RepID=UPI00265D9862|nr:phytochrome-interacting ankyrin-repeat protein 1-like [Rhododendron vialii]